MASSKTEQKLAGLLRRLGAPDPDAWARSQLDEGIPHLERFLFLRSAWRRVVPEDDARWIEAAIASARTDPDAPYAGQGHALAALRARGATNEELTELVRAAQAELLFQICHLLENPDIEEKEVSDVSWQLFVMDDDGMPLQPLTGLHESVLEMDPTGREARPPRRG